MATKTPIIRALKLRYAITGWAVCLVEVEPRLSAKALDYKASSESVGIVIAVVFNLEYPFGLGQSAVFYGVGVRDYIETILRLKAIKLRGGWCSSPSGFFWVLLAFLLAFFWRSSGVR